MTAQEEPKRLVPTKETVARLFALSGNRCAFPTCEHAIFNADGVLIAELCHIEGAERGGERFNSESTNEQRRSLENLVLLCHKHHKVTDDVAKYPADAMRQMKAEHEAKYIEAAEKILEQTFHDSTTSEAPQYPKTLARYMKAYDIDLKPEQIKETIDGFTEFADRLAQVPRNERKLLAIIINRDEAGAVTFSELLKVTKSEEGAIYAAVSLLAKYKLVVIDDENYEAPPTIRFSWRRWPQYWSAAPDLREFSQSSGVALEDMIVDMRLDLLD